MAGNEGNTDFITHNEVDRYFRNKALYIFFKSIIVEHKIHSISEAWLRLSLTFRTLRTFCNTRGIFSGDTADNTKTCLKSQPLHDKDLGQLPKQKVSNQESPSMNLKKLMKTMSIKYHGYNIHRRWRNMICQVISGQITNKCANMWISEVFMCLQLAREKFIISQ